MQSRIANYLQTGVEYFQIVFRGVLRIYAVIGRFILERAKPFRRNEIIYLSCILASMILTSMDWRSYDIIMNTEIIYHGISTDDFLIFVFGFILMAMPGILKFIYFFESKKIFIFFYSAGLVINCFAYTLNAFHPERIAKTSEASFTIWFYLFGLALIISAIFGVLSIVTMPSTHSKN